MDRQHLHTELEQLHRELQAMTIVDSSERQLLVKVAEDIQQILATDPLESSKTHIGSGLQESIEKLEASHPQATILLGKILDTLTNMGL